ncbi:MAG: preprotein translocase subunit SecA [Deltaproteobacteria bacterium]|jgi:preprotein translocase subunit SecA|nr:preprotein translocase subunit SecA [Deltaproteobacteria bacterium]
MFNILKKVFGSANDRIIAGLSHRVDAINALEPGLRKLSDADLQACTAKFKERLDNGEDLDSIVNEAFAVVREAGARTLGQRHFDVQLIGGLVLHQGKIAEMKTGEGKTLAATLPVYANALTGKGVHVVTVNDYLAKRDSEWMGQIYSFLGLTTGTIVHGLNEKQRRDAYYSDITYGTNNELGFDYLRDNMKFYQSEFVQRDFNFAIVDEVDSILIDEARTPLIISGPAEESTELYVRVDDVIPRLVKEVDYTLDEKTRSCNLTENGVSKCETALNVGNLYDPVNMEMLHHVNQALKAHVVFKRDKDYMVKEGQVVIVDEHSGRPMEGRRFSDGLHQALEAKEKVKIENENQTLASITFQNFFRMYSKLSGMTGTADTEAAEFAKIYNLEVAVIPTHRKMIRKDHNDVVFRTVDEKYKAAIEEIEELHQKGQPVLVGTISIDNSEQLSRLLKKRGIPHQVLNAKHLEKEAMIVAQAGQKGMVTISTNMAGRGTDIVLGPEVPALGGLFILGTERHESRRIDNQLRGRSGRQGDPGETRFYISMEDELMRRFGGERYKNILSRLGMEEGMTLVSPMITKGIENAQKHVESINFDIRKQLLDYDDVMNKQREVIYSQRRHILKNENMIKDLSNMLDEESQVLILSHFGDARNPLEVEWADFENECRSTFGFKPVQSEMESLDTEGMMDYILNKALDRMNERRKYFGEGVYTSMVNWLMLQSLDNQWKDHLLNMDRLKEGIGLRGYAQKDPLREYQKEGFGLFEEMADRIRTQSVTNISNFNLSYFSPETPDETAEEPNQLGEEERLLEKIANGVIASRRANLDASEERAGERKTEFTPPGKPKRKADDFTYRHGSSSAGQAPQTEYRSAPKIGRNEPCPCGSGKKYKNCCGNK